MSMKLDIKVLQLMQEYISNESGKTFIFWLKVFFLNFFQLPKVHKTNLQYRCTQNQFIVQVNIKPIYITAVQKTD